MQSAGRMAKNGCDSFDLLIKYPFIFLVFKTCKCVYLVRYVRLPVKFDMSCIFSLRPAKGLH